GMVRRGRADAEARRRRLRAPADAAARGQLQDGLVRRAPHPRRSLQRAGRLAPDTDWRRLLVRVRGRAKLAGAAARERRRFRSHRARAVASGAATARDTRSFGGRIFPNLKPFAPASQGVTKSLQGLPACTARTCSPTTARSTTHARTATSGCR